MEPKGYSILSTKTLPPQLILSGNPRSIYAPLANLPIYFSICAPLTNLPIYLALLGLVSVEGPRRSHVSTKLVIVSFPGKQANLPQPVGQREI